MPRHPLSTVVRFKKLHEEVVLPEQAVDGSSGMDLRAWLPDGKIGIAPGQIQLVPTGFCMELEPGYEAQVRPRSGLACKQGITVVNSPGTIDAGFRGPVQVGLINLGAATHIIEPGDRVAQMVVQPVPRVTVVVLEGDDELSQTERGDGGFGSTGVR